MIAPGMAISLLRHDLFRVTAFIAGCAFIKNFLPSSRMFSSIPRLCWWYELFVDVVSLFALSWRAQSPSLEMEFLGFKRTTRHAIRNWKQGRLDRVYLKGD